MPSSDNDPRSRNVGKGRQHEQIAAEFFQQQGFEVIEQNYRAGRKEIDLIVGKSGLLVFVEVKSAGSHKFGHPSEWVDKTKIQNLTEAAHRYISENDITDTDLRFDVVTFIDGHLEHYPNAFTAEE